MLIYIKITGAQTLDWFESWTQEEGCNNGEDFGLKVACHSFLKLDWEWRAQNTWSLNTMEAPSDGTYIRNEMRRA